MIVLRIFFPETLDYFCSEIFHGRHTYNMYTFHTSVTYVEEFVHQLKNINGV